MGNRDKRNDKVKKPKKDTKVSVLQRTEIGELPPTVEVVKKKRREEPSTP